MSPRALRRAVCGAAAAVCVVVALPALAQQAPQKPATPPKAGADLSGVWLVRGSHENPADFARYPDSEWSTEKLPFTPAGKAKFDANKPGRGPRQVTPAQRNDPQQGANPNGLYRTLMYPRLWEFVQTPAKVVQLFGWGSVWRNIYADGRAVPDDVAAGPFWDGYSVGHWEGDTLVATTLALDDRAWLDEWGTPFTADARIEERWKRIAPDRLQLTITVNDPEYYTRPWTSVPLIFALQPKSEPQEIIFAPMDVENFNRTLRDPSAPK